MLAPEPLSARSLYAQAIRAALLGLVINLALGAVKLVGGLVAPSFALLSDALNSLGDSLSSCVTLLALWYAQRPADREHPYGHTRAEAIAGAYVSILILVSAVFIAGEALGQWGQRQTEPPLWALGIAAANAAIKEALFWYKQRVSAATGSNVLRAVAWDHRLDALCSLAALIGLAAFRWGGPDYSWADEAAALAIVATILCSGSRLLWSATRDLLDPQADDAVVERVRELSLAVPQVQAVEKLWVRKTGIEYFVDVHIQVDPQFSVAAGHQIGHDVKDRVMAHMPAVRDVLVHLEPFEPHGPSTPHC